MFGNPPPPTIDPCFARLAGHRTARGANPMSHPTQYFYMNAIVLVGLRRPLTFVVVSILLILFGFWRDGRIEHADGHLSVHPHPGDSDRVELQRTVPAGYVRPRVSYSVPSFTAAVA